MKILDMPETEEVECTGCSYLSNDGTGPGTIMLCVHPIFNNCYNYENAIVRWAGRPRVVRSKHCPLKLEEKE